VLMMGEEEGTEGATIKQESTFQKGTLQGKK
jgi:hypothetical protein